MLKAFMNSYRSHISWEAGQFGFKNKNKPLACNDPHVNDATTKKFVVWCGVWVNQI